MDYKDLYNRVGRLTGWDFSKVKYQTAGVKWDFYDEVLKKCDNNTVLLDIGTGGGKRVLRIADHLRLLVGVDHSEGMIDTARKNLIESAKKNVRFCYMDAERVDFPSDFFDVVSCRHSNFFPKEIFRILRKGGYFLTQQVSEADKENIAKAFGRGQYFINKDGVELKNNLKEMKEVGFRDIETDTYNSKEWYESKEGLVFLLENTPILPDFGKNKSDYEILDEFIANNKTRKGILTNSKRYKIVAKK